MFQRSDNYWRNDFLDVPVIASHGDIMTGLITNEMDYFEMESIKIELLDGDYEDHLIDGSKSENKYQDLWKMIHEDEPIDMDQAECTNNDRPNDTITANEIPTVQNKANPNLSMNIKQVEPKAVRNRNLQCVLCNEILSSRTSLNRHVVQCIRCPFTTPSRFVK